MSVTPSFAASRLSGVAPLAVHFDATATTSTATLSEFHDVQYDWKFGDAAGGATWGVSGKSKNEASGPIAAHVFETPGTYTVSMTARDADGAATPQTATITVQDPDVVFSGTNTIAFTTDGTFPANTPAGAQRVTTSSLATVAGYAAQGKRLLLERGGTWTSGSPVTINKLGPGIVGAFGDPAAAKPKIVTSGSGHVFVLSGRSPVLEDWRFMDLDLTGSGVADQDAFRLDGTADNVTIDRVDMRDFHVGVGASTSILNYWNANGHPGHTLHDGMAVVNSTVDHGQGGSGGYGMYIAGKRLTLMGNRITDMDQVEHDLRSSFIQKAAISHNLLSTPATGKHNIKVHAPTWSEAGIGYQKYSEQVVISDNVLQGATNDYTLSIGPMNGDPGVSDQRVRDVVIENNHLKSGSGTSRAAILWAQRSSVRNNVFTLASGDAGVEITRRGDEPTPADNRVINNTFYVPGGGSATGAIISSAAASTKVRNNLLAHAGTVLSNSSTTTSHSNNQTLSSPGFVSATPTAPADFKLQDTSNAVDAGTAVPQWSDFGGRDRPKGAGYDLGAWENQGVVQPEVTLVPKADTYGRDGTYSATNFGQNATLVVKQHVNPGDDRESFLRFDLTDVSSVSSAVLRLRARATSTDAVTVSVRGMAAPTTAWAEDTLTWDNRPAAGTTSLGSFTASSGTSSWFSVDVTPYLQAEKAAGRNLVTLVLVSPTATASAAGIDSRESAYSPELVVS